MPNLEINTQWLTFALINIILAGLVNVDRKPRKAKWVYPGLLLLCILIEIPIYFDSTTLSWWQIFSQWFTSLLLNIISM